MESSRFTDLGHVGDVVNNFIELGNLSTTIHRQFWTNLNNPDASTAYLTVLLTKLIGLDSGDRTSNISDLVKKFIIDNVAIDNSSINFKPLPEEVSSLRGNLLNTVYFLALYYKFNLENPHLRSALTKWGQVSAILSKSEGIDRASRLDLFTDDVAAMLKLSNLEAQDILRLVDQCSTIDNSPGVDFITEKLDPRLTFTSLIDNYLRGLLIDEALCKSILENILLFLKHPLLSEKRMLSLFHILKHYILLAPKVPVETLTQALATTKNYYLWPRPYGDVARDLLQLLTIELKAPGTGLRKKIIEENPELIRGSPKTGRERVVHIFYDRESTNSRIVGELLRSQNVPDTPSHQLQVNVLANILSTVLQVENVKSLGLDGLSKDDLTKFFEASLQILGEAVLMKQEDAEGFRFKELSALKDEIIMAPRDAAGTSGLSPPQPPTLPPLQFEYIPVSLDNSISPPTDEATKVKYLKRQSYESLASIVGKYAAYGNPNNKPVIRIGLIGSDVLANSILSSYVYLRSVAPRSFDGLDVQFFFVPTESAIFSSFLGRYDGWYSRNIVCLTKCALRTYPCLAAPSAQPETVVSPQSRPPGGTRAAALSRAVPKVDPSTQPKEEEKVTPGAALRNELESYFREAKWRLEINLYQCECWGSDGSYFTVPFFQRAEIGMKAANALSTAQQQKKFTYNPASVTIKCVSMNPFGALKQGQTIEKTIYHSITLANIPVAGDRGVPPNPTKPWIELTLIEADKKKKGKGGDDPMISLHTSSVDIECDDKKKQSFAVMLDGSVYGPFVRIKVTSIMNTNEEVLNATFMTFVPLDLLS